MSEDDGRPTFVLTQTVVPAARGVWVSENDGRPTFVLTQTVMPAARRVAVGVQPSRR